MFENGSEKCTYGPALFGLLDGFCFEFGGRAAKVAARASTFTPIITWATAFERVLERVFGSVEGNRNSVPIIRGGVSFELRQTQDYGTLVRDECCHD